MLGFFNIREGLPFQTTCKKIQCEFKSDWSYKYEDGLTYLHLSQTPGVSTLFTSFIVKLSQSIDFEKKGQIKLIILAFQYVDMNAYLSQLNTFYLLSIIYKTTCMHDTIIFQSVP